MWIEDIETPVNGNEEILEALHVSFSYAKIKKELGDRSILVNFICEDAPLRRFKLVGVPNFDEIEEGECDSFDLTEEHLDPESRYTALREDPEVFIYLTLGPINLTMTRGTVSRFVRDMAKVTQKLHE